MRPPNTTQRCARLPAAFVLVFSLAAASLAPTAAMATDDTRRKAALSLLEVAKFYYQSGKFLKAAKGFHEAYAIDPRPEFLFNAARAEHLGMDLANAEKHYQECLVLKTSNAKLNQRAKLYLAQVQATRAAIAKARNEGKAAAEARQKQEAAKNAKAASGSTEAALEGVDKVKAAKPEPDKKPAATAAEPREKPENKASKPEQPDPSAAQPTPSPMPPQPATSAAWRTPVGWGATALGAVAVGLSVVVMLDYAEGQQALDDLVAKKDADGKIIGIGSADYRHRQTELNSQNTNGVIGLAAGAVLLGGGAWVLLSKPSDRVALAPWSSGRGWTLTARF